MAADVVDSGVGEDTALVEAGCATGRVEDDDVADDTGGTGSDGDAG